MRCIHQQYWYMVLCRMIFLVSSKIMLHFIDMQVNLRERTVEVVQMGTGYKGNADHYHRVAENLDTLKAEYGFHNGLFGVRGQGKSENIRNIASDDPQKTAKEFYDKLAYGGIEEPLLYRDGTVKGFQTKMADGTIINWRAVSSSPDKSPAVDIDVQYSDEHGVLVQQKIHFVMR